MDKVYSVFIMREDSFNVEQLSASIGELGSRVSCKEFHSFKEFSATIKEKEYVPNLVIYDAVLGNSLRNKVSDLLNSVQPNVPFYVFGKLSESETTQAIEKGADRVIPVDHLDRLQPLLKKELERHYERKKVSRDVKERVKEQECLYQVTSLNESQYSIEKLLERAVNLIPDGFQYPEITEAQIIFNNKSFQTDGFRQTPWMLNKPLDIENFGHISINVAYTQNRQEANKGSFLLEEEKLIDALAKTLVQKVKNIEVNQRLHHQKKLLHEAYKVAKIGHWELNFTSNNLYWSDLVKEIHEVPTNYQPNLDDAIAFYETEHKKVIKDLLKKLMVKGEEYKADLKITSAKGNDRWIRSTGKAETKGQRVVRLFGSVQDITHEKETEEKLRKSEQRYKSLYKDNYASILIVDPQSSKIVDANYSALDFYGYSSEEIEGMNLESLVKGDKEKLSETLAEIKQGSKKRLELKQCLSDGTIKDTIIYAGNIQLEKKEVVYCIVFDNTERKKAEKELRKLSKATEQSPALIMITDIDGTIEYVNPKFVEVCEYSKQELIGENPRILKSGVHDKQFYKNLWDTIKEGEIFESEITNKKKNGELYQVFVRVAPLYDNNGNITNFISVQQNITEHKKTKYQLKKSLKENQVLLNEVHHRVRNNLAVVSGIMELQAMDEINDTIREMLFENITRIKSMGLVHELLYNADNFSKIDFGETVKGIVQMLKENENRKIKINFNFQSQQHKLNVNQALPTALIIREIVSKIFKDSFKEIGKPEIIITSRLKEDNYVLIIEDNGHNISSELKSDGNETIGLQLINTLVAQLEGKYEYQSTESGNVFKLTFKKANISGSVNAYLR